MILDLYNKYISPDDPHISFYSDTERLVRSFNLGNSRNCDVFQIKLPLKIKTYDRKRGLPKAKDFFILNLNNYRNVTFIKLAQSKDSYKKIIHSILDDSDIPNGLFWDKELRYRFDYWHGNNRRLDPANPLSVIEKYSFDALVDYGLFEDDNYDHVVGSDGWDFRGVIKEKGVEGFAVLTIYNID